MLTISTPQPVLDNPGLPGKIGEFKTKTMTMSSVDKNENDLPNSKQKIVHGKVHDGKQTRGELQYFFSEADLETALHSLSSIGAERELLQMLTSEPMMLLTAMGFYMVTGSFNVAVIASSGRHLIRYLPGVFSGLTFVLTIKFRKSPFDLSTSHHAHQELVKGISTEFAGPSLALIEIEHWYETILWLGMIWLFLAFDPVFAVAGALIVYLLEVLIDNANSRVKWQLMLKSAFLPNVTTRLGGRHMDSGTITRILGRLKAIEADYRGEP